MGRKAGRKGKRKGGGGGGRGGSSSSSGSSSGKPKLAPTSRQRDSSQGNDLTEHQPPLHNDFVKEEEEEEEEDDTIRICMRKPRSRWALLPTKDGEGLRISNMRPMPSPSSPLSEELSKEDEADGFPPGPHAEDIANFVKLLFDFVTKQAKERHLWRAEGDTLWEFFKLFVEQFMRENKELRDELAAKLGATRLLFPTMRLFVPLSMLEEYNVMEATDPRFIWFCLHPLYGAGLKDFGLCLDRFDTNSEVICFFIWSEVDQRIFSLPNLSLKPYPLCWNANADNSKGCQSFGVKLCGQCGVARYCSRECQKDHWKKHKHACAGWKERLKQCDLWYY